MKISLEDFKNEVLRDFKIACLGDIISQRSQFALSSGSSVAQVALAKYIAETDKYWPCTTDISLSLAKDYVSLEDIKNNSICIYSNSVESACSEARKKTDEGRVVFTIDSSLVLNSNFFGQVVGAAESAIAIVVWATPSDILAVNLIKALGNQAFFAKGHKALNVVTVKGNDYAALCRTFEQQLNYTSSQKTLSITIVENTSNDSTEAFETWITEKGISEKAKLEDIRQACTNIISVVR